MSGNNNIYHDSCAVLLQAILTQACRAILSLAAAARHASPERFTNTSSAAAVAHFCLSTSTTTTIIESMNRHTLLTAVHLLCCDHSPHRKCRHQGGELAAAVDTVLQDDALRSTILTALAELIMRKWSKDEVTGHPLLRRAMSAGPTTYTIVPSSRTAMSLPLALLQVYPQLTVSNSNAEVSCGCPHQWFRETLPDILVSATMEQHARMWRRTNLFLRVFLRWRRRHGMSLLYRIAAAAAGAGGVSSKQSGDSPPEVSASTHTPSTIRSEPLEVSERHITQTCGLVNSQCHLSLSNVHLKDAKPISKANDAVRGIHKGDGAVLAADALAAVDVCGNALVKDSESSERLPLVVSPGSEHTTEVYEAEKLNNSPLDAEDLSVVASLHFSIALKRTAFHYWRHVRLVERACVKQMHMRLCAMALRRAWQRWRHRLSSRLSHRHITAADDACVQFLAAAREQNARRVFLCWWRAFAARRFGIHTIARRFFAQWRRTFLFAVCAGGKALPRIAARALATRCMTHWRAAWHTRVANRFILRRCLCAMSRAVRAQETRRFDHCAALAHWRDAMTRNVFCRWRRATDSIRATRAAAAFCTERFTRTVLSHWRERRVRRVALTQRLQCHNAKVHARRLKALFAQWRKRLRVRVLFRTARAQCRRVLCVTVLLRWRAAAFAQCRWRRDSNAFADTVRERALLRAALVQWGLAQRNGARRRKVAAERAQLCEFAERQERRVVAGAFFAWKGRALLRTRRGVPVGVNRSFPQQWNVSLGAEAAAGDPLAALRAERALLRGIRSPQWQSRLFGAGAAGRGSRDPTLSVMVPSDVEEDLSPSVDNSGVGGVV